LSTTKALLADVLDDPAFRAARHDTALLDELLRTTKS
jgi:hypothetical protein